MSSSGQLDPNHENHSDDDLLDNGDSGDNGPPRRHGRGFNKPKWGKSGKESIEFTKDGLCIVPKDAKLSRYLGSLERNYHILPLSPLDWRSHDEPKMEKIWKIISDTIDWRAEDIPHIPTIRYTLLKRLSKRIRNNRADLKRKYYTPHVGSPSHFVCGDDRVDNDQWRKMVNYWDNDPKNKVRVERNTTNRKKLKTSHTSGSMSFIRHLANFKEKYGHEADPIEAYELLHRRKDKQKSWVDNASEQVAAKISHELTQLVEAHGEETPELRLQAYVATMGFETRNRVRCYGDLVTPSMVPWVKQTQPELSIRKSRKGRDYASLKSKCLNLQDMCEKQSKEIEELRVMILSSQRQSPSSDFISQPSSSQRRSSLEHQAQQSPTQHQPNTHQTSTVQYQPLLQQHSASQHCMSHPQQGPYQFSSSSCQFYYPQVYRPPFYPQMPYSLGEYTSILNGVDVTQQVVPPKNSQTGEFTSMLNGIQFTQQVAPPRNNQSREVTSVLNEVDFTQVMSPRNNPTNES